jgi:predicted dehydrogenase
MPRLRSTTSAATEVRLRIGIVGCGDVAHRNYLPALATAADLVAVVAFADPRDGAAEAAAAAVASWSPGSRLYRDVAKMLEVEELDGVFDLTPGPRHGDVNRTILAAGVACFSEKPLATTVAEADELIDLAADRGVLFLSAPGSALTGRTRTVRELLRSGRLGRATLAVAQHAGRGPADWDEYTGDPAPFYREGVGPVFDHGVYRLHDMTTILGPVCRVQAIGSIALPSRRVLAGPRAGQAFEVTTPDHVLIQLEFASGALGQLVASFASADTLAPWLEIQFEDGVISFGGKPWGRRAPAMIYDASPGASKDWEPLDLPPDEHDVVELGARHFIECLAGTAAPVLTAEHGRHVLEVILQSYASIADGRTHDVETRFAQ